MAFTIDVQTPDMAAGDPPFGPWDYRCMNDGLRAEILESRTCLGGIKAAAHP